MIAAPEGREYAWIYLGMLWKQGMAGPFDRLLLTFGCIGVDPLYQLVQAVSLVQLQHLPERPGEKHERDQRYEQEGPKKPEQEETCKEDHPESRFRDGEEQPDQSAPIQCFSLIRNGERSLLLRRGRLRLVVGALRYVNMPRSHFRGIGFFPESPQDGMSLTRFHASRVLCDYLLAEGYRS